MSIITIDNYQNHHFRCDDCWYAFDGIEVELTDCPDGREWEIICPNCGERVLAFLKEQPDFSSLTPDQMQPKHWALLEALLNHMQQTPELFDRDSESSISIPKYIEAICEPFKPFLTQFDWMKWDKRVVITEDKEQLHHLNFGTAMALLYTWYREDRFDETHLKWTVDTGRMEMLISKLLGTRTA